MEKSVAIIDYGVGNLTSVRNALLMLDVDAKITDDQKELAAATHLILPGVGSFKEGMEGLKKRGLTSFLQEQVLERKKKILGICLGMQLLAEKGFEHGEEEGLKILSGSVVKIDTSISKVRLPHIGWNTVEKQGGSFRILTDLPDEPIFYFVHSYKFVPEEKSIIAGVVEYGEKVVAMVEKENIFGVQFHPEKSHMDGLQILKIFLECNA